MDVLSFFRKFVMQNFRFETKIGDSFLKVNYVRSFSFDFSLKEGFFSPQVSRKRLFEKDYLAFHIYV